MKRNLIIGDVHGQYSRLQDVLERGGYDPERDTLYSVGDLADRGPESVKVLRFLKSLKDFRPVLGNHDMWLRDYLLYDETPDIWVHGNGGSFTIRSFSLEGVDTAEKRALGEWVASFPAVRIENWYIIIHGGNAGMSEEELASFAREGGRVDESNSLYDCVWDRDYLYSAYGDEKHDPNVYLLPMKTEKLIFIGHTPLETRPLYFPSYHLVATDSRAARMEGHLSLIDMDTLDYWMSGVDGRFSLCR